MASQRSDVNRVHYTVKVENANAHLWRVIVDISQPLAKQQFQLPVWIPGSYLVREFSKQLSEMRAFQAEESLPVKQRDKATWEVACKPSLALQLQYLVHAHDHSVRTAWLDANRGFFNGTSLFVQVTGKQSPVIQLTLPKPTHTDLWNVATSLTPIRVDRAGFGQYQAQSYDELVDSPVEMSAFKQSEFSMLKSKHRIIVTGAPPSFDMKRLAKDVEKNFFLPFPIFGTQEKHRHSNTMFFC